MLSSSQQGMRLKQYIFATVMTSAENSNPIGSQVRYVQGPQVSTGIDSRSPGIPKSADVPVPCTTWCNVVCKLQVVKAAGKGGEE